jgi:SagB-type dehydrogenase family enzyme
VKKTAPKIKTPEIKITWGLPLVTTILVVVLLLAGGLLKNKNNRQTSKDQEEPEVITNPNIIPLPSPTYRTQNSVEAVIRTNQARRSFTPSQLSLKQVGQMLWSAQGVTTDWGGRTVTSSKSTFPLTIYILANNVEKLEKGVYRYIPGERLPAHQLLPHKLGDFGATLFDIVNQTSLKEPPVVAIVTGNLNKMAEAYGGVNHDKEVYLEAGSAVQNMYLQAESLKLGMIALPNFDESQVRLLLSIPREESIIYLAPVGTIKE